MAGQLDAVIGVSQRGEDRLDYADMYAVSAARVTRHVVPIFLPFSSPDSSTLITSASLTPRACAASAGLISSGGAGGPAAPVPGSGPGIGGTAIVGAA